MTAREVVLAAVEAVFATLAAAVFAIAAAMSPTPGRWLVGAGQVAVAAACVVSIRVAKQAAKRGVPIFLRTSFEEVMALVSELDEQDRTAVHADLDLALARLADAGVISQVQLDEAHRAPLGSLARRQWALERSPARQAR